MGRTEAVILARKITSHPKYVVHRFIPIVGGWALEVSELRLGIRHIIHDEAEWNKYSAGASQ